MYNDRYTPSSITATNELPLTELNLTLFTSESGDDIPDESRASSTNDLPLCDIKLKSDELKRGRSFSDPNLTDESKTDKDDLSTDSRSCEPLSVSTSHLSPDNIPIYPFSFFPNKFNRDKYLLNAPPSRTASQPAQLSLSANKSNCSSVTYQRSLSDVNDNLNPNLYPLKRAPSPPIVITQSPVNPEVCSGAKRHRHSIAGQMSYIKMLGFGFGGPIGLKKMTGGSSNSLFSTAVISGSSSAPNLRDMIPSTASATGNISHNRLSYFPSNVCSQLFFLQRSKVSVAFPQFDLWKRYTTRFPSSNWTVSSIR